MRRLELAGQRFGRLVAESIEGSTVDGLILWRCRCDCGTVCIIIGKLLKRGQTKSCGCLRRDQCGNNFRKHGQVHSLTWSSWEAMRTRTSRPDEHHAIYYAGITVCDRWRDSFEAFLEDMGERPTKGHTLDRWPNKYGNYEPGNCRWATKREQALNRRPRGSVIPVEGEIKQEEAA